MIPRPLSSSPPASSSPSLSSLKTFTTLLVVSPHRTYQSIPRSWLLPLSHPLPRSSSTYHAPLRPCPIFTFTRIAPPFRFLHTTTTCVPVYRISTGDYVSPQPIFTPSLRKRLSEQVLYNSPFVRAAPAIYRDPPQRRRYRIGNGAALISKTLDRGAQLSGRMVRPQTQSRPLVPASVSMTSKDINALASFVLYTRVASQAWQSLMTRLYHLDSIVGHKEEHSCGIRVGPDKGWSLRRKEAC